MTGCTVVLPPPGTVASGEVRGGAPGTRETDLLRPGMLVQEVHAVLLTGVTSVLHFRLGNVDPKLVAYLLIGSVPGGLLGSQLTTRMPVQWLRRLLCAILMATGARMLWT